MSWTKPTTVNTIDWSKPTFTHGVLTLYDDATVLYDSATLYYDGVYVDPFPISTVWSEPTTVNTVAWTKPVITNTV